MFRQLPARSLRLANTSAITFPLPSIHQFPFTSFFPFSPPKISPLSSPLSSPCLLTRIRYDDVEKLKNRWRNSVLPLFLNFPSQEKPTTRRQHSTLNTCPSLLTSNRTIFQPQLPSIPVFEGIGFLESSKSSALPKNMEARVSICFPLFHSSRDPKRAGVIKGEAALLEADFHRLIYFSA